MLKAVSAADQERLEPILSAPLSDAAMLAAPVNRPLGWMM